jgi:hypothetical protein
LSHFRASPPEDTLEGFILKQEMRRDLRLQLLLRKMAALRFRLPDKALDLVDQAAGRRLDGLAQDAPATWWEERRLRR